MAVLNPYSYVGQPDIAGGYLFICVGCRDVHAIPVRKDPFTPNGPVWTFNGDLVKPTFTPSVLRHGHPGSPRCHLFVRDGMLQFLGDCEHTYANKTVPIPEWTGWPE